MIEKHEYVILKFSQLVTDDNQSVIPVTKVINCYRLLAMVNSYANRNNQHGYPISVTEAKKE